MKRSSWKCVESQREVGWSGLLEDNCSPYSSSPCVQDAVDPEKLLVTTTMWKTSGDDDKDLYMIHIFTRQFSYTALHLKSSMKGCKPMFSMWTRFLI